MNDGYGPLDNKMAEQLRAAKTQDEASQIARENGLRDARDAASWLRERSQDEPAREAEDADREAGS